jgi:hypothetical protein
MNRRLPWSDLVEAIGEEHFDEIRRALAASGVRDLDRDAFLLNGPAAAVLRELMPDDAPADTVAAYSALLHMLYVTWARDWPLAFVSSDELRGALSSPRPLTHASTHPLVCYLQLPERLVWAEPVSGDPHEPLDGVFVIATREKIHVLAILGFRREREGFTTMEGAIELPAPAPVSRRDGTHAFGAVMPGGNAAGLISLVDEHELATLVMRSLEATATA